MANEDHILFENERNLAKSQACPRPKAYGAFLQMANSDRDIVSYWVRAIGNRAAKMNALSPKAVAEIEWETIDPSAHLTANFDVKVLRRKDHIDVAIIVKTGFTPPFTNQQKLDRWDPVVSYYQDQVSFSILPVKYRGVDTPSLFDINPNGTAPETKNGAVDYTASRSWNVRGGFKSKVGQQGVEAGELDFSVGYSVSEGSKRSVHDFEVKKNSDNQKKMVTWELDMKNRYFDNNQSDSYSRDNTQALAIYGALTTWLSDVPDMAKSDMNPEFMAAYQGPESAKDAGSLYFQFACEQHLNHAEVIGRGGWFKESRTGGQPISVRGIAVLEGILEINLKTGSLEIHQADTEFWSMRNIVNDDVQSIVDL